MEMTEYRIKETVLANGESEFVVQERRSLIWYGVSNVYQQKILAQAWIDRKRARSVVEVKYHEY